MKNMIWIFGLLVVSMIYVIGCGSSKTTNANVTPQTVSCASGTYYSNGTCYGVSGSTSPSQLIYTNGFYADNHSGTSRITIVNAAKMKDLFKYGMGVCDRGAKDYQNIGQANCDYYINGSLDIIIQFAQGNANNMLATFIAKPKINPYVNYTGQLPSGWGLLGAALGMTTGIWLPDPSYYQGAYRNPLQLQMAVSDYNNSAGFKSLGYGDYWTGFNRTLLAIQVLQGKAEDQMFNFDLMISGVKAAEGVMLRCQYQNCGL